MNEWDDENHDYIIRPGEEIQGRWVIRERIGKVFPCNSSGF